MTNQQLDEERIFHVARDIAVPESRAEYLGQVCAGDQALRERVEELLRVHEQEQSFLKSNGDLLPTEAMGELNIASGQQIGRYKLLQKIGEGGFGVVFMAEQSRPVRRKVALKVIKPGMDTEAVVARFEAERQALAMMDHPNIARVFDGGATNSGRPYFVMELVKGIPITEYCDKNQLNTFDRLALFITVCRAVQHAHQKGIIHRDLKPSNILVTLHDGAPVVKVIDFGVAKATNQQLTERTLFTLYGQMVGTPQYMSPEQAEMSGLDVDTRSDIYSLGVLLYELLTGATPLDSERLRAAGYVEMQRLIREEAPPKPSTRLSTSGEQLTVIAKDRSVSPEGLRKALRGDLDWIVMKALDKDRGRRYGTAIEIGDDIDRYLRREPVEACPPTFRYKVSRFLHRNVAAVSVVAMLLFILLIGSAGTTIGMFRANSEAKRANTEAKRANEAAKRASDESTKARESQLAAEKERDRRVREQYVSDMNLAMQAYEEFNLDRMTEVLERYGPQTPYHRELCGFEWHYLDRLAKRTLNSQRWPLSYAGGKIHFFDDDRRLLVTQLDDTVSILEMEQNGDELKLVAREELGQKYRFLYSRDVAIPIPGRNQFLRRAQSGVGLEIVDPTGQASPMRLDGFRGKVSATAVSNDGSVVVAGTLRGSLLVWDVSSSEQLVNADLDGQISALQFSPDSNDFYVATSEGVVLHYPLPSDPGSQPAKCQYDKVAAWAICLSPDSRFLMLGCEDGILRKVDRESLTVVDEIDLENGPIRSIAFSPDEQQFATGHRRTGARLWSWPTFELVTELKGHTGSALGVAFHPSGRFLLTTGSDATIRAWRTDAFYRRESVAIANAPHCLVQLEQDNSWFLGSRRDCLQWDLDTVRRRGIAGRSLNDFSIALCNQSGIGIGVDNDGVAWRFDLTADKIVKAFDLPLDEVPLAISEDASLLLVGRSGGTPSLWNLHDKRKICELPMTCINDHYGHAFADFSPDGEYFALSATDYSIAVFRTRDQSELARLKGHKRGVVGLVFDPNDSNRIASASWDRTAKLWEIDPEKCITTMKHSGWLSSIAFSPDSSRLVTSSADRSIKLWTTDSGQQVVSIPSGVSHPRRLRFSKDGLNIILTGARTLQAFRAGEVREM